MKAFCCVVLLFVASSSSFAVEKKDGPISLPVAAASPSDPSEKECSDLLEVDQDAPVVSPHPLALTLVQKQEEITERWRSALAQEVYRGKEISPLMDPRGSLKLLHSVLESRSPEVTLKPTPHPLRLILSEIYLLYRTVREAVSGLPLSESDWERIEQWYETQVLVATSAFGQSKHRKEIGVLQQEVKLRDQFVVAVVHDLRNPISAIRIAADLLMKGPDEEEHRKRTAARIVRGTERLNRMVSDLLDANRIHAGHPIFQKIESCDDFSQILVRTLEGLTLNYGDRFVLDSESGISGYWDPDGVARIIENLCSNAVKFGNPDSPIIVSLKLRDQGVELSVHNWGPEISDEDIARIGNIYEQSRKAKNKKSPGWGIGLTVVKGTVEAHGGVLSVTSNPKDGTTFRIFLPLDARPFQGGQH